MLRDVTILRCYLYKDLFEVYVLLYRDTYNIFPNQIFVRPIRRVPQEAAQVLFVNHIYSGTMLIQRTSHLITTPL